MSDHAESHFLRPDGAFPNNPHLPLLVYREAMPSDCNDLLAAVEQTLAKNGWTGIWLNGVYPFHHYHSNAHEFLGIVGGLADVQFGGPGGPVVTVSAGDAAVLPAGTAHKRISASTDFLVVGAYPPGQADYDTLRGDDDAAKGALERIAAVHVPTMDPLFGEAGPLLEKWSKAR
jgi:uncharacterized protein YjlB